MNHSEPLLGEFRGVPRKNSTGRANLPSILFFFHTPPSKIFYTGFSPLQFMLEFLFFRSHRKKEKFERTRGRTGREWLGEWWQLSREDDLYRRPGSILYLCQSSLVDIFWRLHVFVIFMFLEAWMIIFQVKPPRLTRPHALSSSNSHGSLACCTFEWRIKITDSDFRTVPREHGLYHLNKFIIPPFEPMSVRPRWLIVLLVSVSRPNFYRLQGKVSLYYTASPKSRIQQSP